jgi:hypothetical protein
VDLNGTVDDDLYSLIEIEGNTNTHIDTSLRDLYLSEKQHSRVNFPCGSRHRLQPSGTLGARAHWSGKQVHVFGFDREPECVEM